MPSRSAGKKNPPCGGQKGEEKRRTGSGSGGEAGQHRIELGATTFQQLELGRGRRFLIRLDLFQSHLDLAEFDQQVVMQRDFVDTEAMFLGIFADLRQRKIIP